jgi:hypothetical protein
MDSTVDSHPNDTIKTIRLSCDVANSLIHVHGPCRKLCSAQPTLNVSMSRDHCMCAWPRAESRKKRDDERSLLRPTNHWGIYFRGIINRRKRRGSNFSPKLKLNVVPHHRLHFRPRLCCTAHPVSYLINNTSVVDKCQVTDVTKISKYLVSYDVDVAGEQPVVGMV